MLIEKKQQGKNHNKNQPQMVAVARQPPTITTCPQTLSTLVPPAKKIISIDVTNSNKRSFIPPLLLVSIDPLGC